MFERTRERIEDIKESRAYQKVMMHFEDYGTTYLVASATGLGCFIGGMHFRRPITVIVEPVFNNTVAPTIAPVMHNIGNHVMNNGSYARKLVRCVETDEIWASMSKAAAAAGYSLPMMSNHIHGRTESLNGLHYVIEGISAS